VKNIVFNFEYYSPNTVDEVLKLLSQDEEEATKMIAGGQSLLILLKQRLITPKCLIDIKGLTSLDYIKFDSIQGLQIGALTTHRSIENSPIIREKFLVLFEMEQNLSSVETRNCGTIGGNLSHGDPSGDPMPVFMALNSKLKIASPTGERIVDADDFTTGYYETALHHNELLTEIQVPPLPPHTGVKYIKFSQITGDHANASAAVSITLDGSKKKCKDARIIIGSVEPAPLRVKKAEDILKGKIITDDLLVEVGRIASEESNFTSDNEASKEYKQELAGVLVKRAGKEALQRAIKA
jgi:aerobic carbon-monoxide dehydrogenase medium subunit